MPKFDIDVTRVGVGSATISVEADSQAEAEDKALDEAGDHVYNEKSSEYELTHRRTEAQAEASAAAPAAPGAAMSDRPDLSQLSVHDLMQEVRRRGHVPCVWSPQDLIDAGRAHSEDAALEMLSRASGVLGDRMTEVGWGVIDDLFPKQPPLIDNPVSLIVTFDPYENRPVSVELVDRTGQSHDLPEGDFDDDILGSGDCIAEGVTVKYPRASRHGVPDFATDGGARKAVEDAGFFVPPNLEVDAEDTGDDTPAVLVLSVLAPREVVLDQAKYADALSAADSDLARQRDRG